MEDCASSDEDYYYSSDRDSLDGLENEDSDLRWAPSKGPTTKVNSFSSFSPFLVLFSELNFLFQLSFIHRFLVLGLFLVFRLRKKMGFLGVLWITWE